jgi:hypothetical protein
MAFANKVNKFIRQLHESDQVTKYLQTQQLSLSEGHVALDAFIYGVVTVIKTIHKSPSINADLEHTILHQVQILFPTLILNQEW